MAHLTDTDDKMDCGLDRNRKLANILRGEGVKTFDEQRVRSNIILSKTTHYKICFGINL